MKSKKLFFILLLPVIFLAGCAKRIKPNSFLQISLGLTKKQVTDRIGKPAIARGSMVNKYNQVVEIWEYQVDRGLTGSEISANVAATVFTLGFAAPLLNYEGSIETYWLYFHNDRLVQWGKAGDWKKEADAIYEVRWN